MKKLAGVATFALVLAACTSVSSPDAEVLPPAGSGTPTSAASLEPASLSMTPPGETPSRPATDAGSTTTTAAITGATEEPTTPPPDESPVLSEPQAAIGLAITPDGATYSIDPPATSIDLVFTVTWSAPPADKGQVTVTDWFATLSTDPPPTCTYAGDELTDESFTLDLNGEETQVYVITACGVTEGDPNPGPWSVTAQVAVMRASP